MKIWVYVEGRSDKLALEALWNRWMTELRSKGWGIQLIPLRDKTQYFKQTGPRVAEKLAGDRNDLVVGLPDLYPNKVYSDTAYSHRNLAEIRKLQEELVMAQLVEKFHIKNAADYMNRFYASALKHDLEMLLLASESQLTRRLNRSKRKNTIGGWIKPPENQNQNKPPKKIIVDLFRRYTNKSYRETKDAPAILREAELREVVLDEHGQSKCPAFQEVVEWIGQNTGVLPY